jgi:transcriptional regulator with XRE-family HTH domain
MELKLKLKHLMHAKGLNGQRLSRLSQVSDSEISRILQGKSRPGLDNALRLARALEVSLDYLADDKIDSEPADSGDVFTTDERKVMVLTQKIGGAETLAILENVRFLGYETAMSRLVGAKPIIEIEKDAGIDLRSSMANAGASVRTATASA